VKLAFPPPAGNVFRAGEEQRREGVNHGTGLPNRHLETRP
jgi:hypothetical protein